jgi:hypothetical protein
MALNASDTGSGVDFEPAPGGTHIARCVSMIDIGTSEYEWQGEVKSRRQVFIMFELPNTKKTYTNKEGQEVIEPFCVSGFYTLSLGDKANLTHLLQGWRGKEFTDEEKAKFDISVLVGKSCLLSVVRYTKQNGKPGSKIQSASGLADGMECPPQFNKSVLFSFDDFDQGVFDGLSEGLKKMVMKSDEYGILSGKAVPQPPQSENPAPPADDFDEVPF